MVKPGPDQVEAEAADHLPLLMTTTPSTRPTAEDEDHQVAGLVAQEAQEDPVGLEDLVEEEVVEAMDRVAQAVLERTLSLICQRCGRGVFVREDRFGGRLCRLVLGTITSLVRRGSGSIPLG